MSSRPERAMKLVLETAGRLEASQATPVGFEPTRADPIGLAGRRLNRSAKVSASAHTRINIDIHILGTLIRSVGQVVRALHRFLDMRRSGPAGSMH